MDVNINALTNIVGSLGTAAFGSEFFSFFNNILGISQCTVFSIGSEAKPASVFLERPRGTPKQEALGITEEYLGGAFRHDPNLRHVDPSASVRCFAIQAKEIDDAGYRRRFYDELQLEHELVMTGGAGDIGIYASFYRKAQAFSDADVVTLESAAPFLLRALHRHWQIQGPALAGQDASVKQVRERSLAHLRSVLLAEPQRLSPREAEVCASIIMGYSALAISLNSGMSVNTVATHRKRAYAKLKIGSQNELFSRYFNSVRRFEEDGALH